jgi:hypothetical protein
LEEGLSDRKIADHNARKGVSKHRSGTAPMAVAQPLEIGPDAPPTLVGFLVSYDGNPLGQSWPIRQGRNLIGRLGASGGADVELPHATVSHQHATVWASANPNRMQLVAQQTTNGTCIASVTLPPDERRELSDGTRISFGLFNLIVKII